MNALAFMLAAKLAAGAMLRECAHCSDLFEVGRGAARRESARFCSPEHQKPLYLAEAYAAKGRFADAADTLLRITSEIDRRSVEDAARLLRSAPGKTDAPEKLPALVAELDFVYAYIGAPERMLEFPEKATKEGIAITVSTLWRPTAAPLRKTERFKALIRNAGLVDYWRARGWPDLCRPVDADDFVCD